MQEPSYTEPMACAHCLNVAPFQKLAQWVSTQEIAHDSFGGPESETEVYGLVGCLSCSRVSLVLWEETSYWHPDDYRRTLLYPAPFELSKGIPAEVGEAWLSAEKVRRIDTNAYGVMLRRVLELACEDRSAEGDTLAKQLGDLAKKGEIPSKLVGVAKGLRVLGNVGAHASAGSLSAEAAPALHALIRAILDYIYVAPALVQEAERLSKQAELVATVKKIKKAGSTAEKGDQDADT